MIVKQRGFKWSSGTLYGFAGGVFGVVTTALMINSQLAPETYAACSQRYAQAGMFALKRSSGDLLNPAELQSRLAGNEWGVLHNVAIKPDDVIHGKAAMAINFQPGGKVNHETRRSPSGASFKWQPGFLKKTAGACLSYSMYLPNKFDFARGGTLPGLFGASQIPTPDGKAPFSTRMRWLTDGKAGIQAITAESPKGKIIATSDQWLRLPRGRWVEIEQEVVLNTPGKRNGHIRIWIDGALQLNRGGFAFRKNASERFAGVIADTHYADRGMNWSPAPKATEIKFSQMIVRWN